MSLFAGAALALLLAPGPKFPLEILAVRGLSHYSQEQVLQVAGLKLGQLVSQEDFETARDRLEASGVFETVSYRFAPSSGGKGYRATLEVVEVAPVYPVRFEDLAVPAADLLAWLRGKDPFFGEKIPATQALLDRHAQAIAEFLSGRGQKQDVIGKVVSPAPEQYEVVFRPMRAPAAIAQVLFEGNEIVKTDVLQNTIAGVAFGVPYSELRVRQLLDASIRPLYEAKGHIRVAFPKISTEKSTVLEALVVHVTIDEGPQYTLKEVRAGSAELVKIAAIATGETANFDEIHKGLERVRKSFRRQGYLKAETGAGRSIDDRARTLVLEIRAEPGPQYAFGKLGIEGLDIHGEAAIKKLWTLKPGKPFNADYPNFFLEQVRERGVFDNLGKTRATVQLNDQERTADVTLHFR
ncbi:MAG: hypothetical protein FJW37_05750 [Acidobacteria bacterium]|nr:hypothetical protein [Acidobacteriota bacterium]